MIEKLNYIKRIRRNISERVFHAIEKWLEDDFLIENYSHRLAILSKDMAKTGRGTDECLEQGCLPVPVHFYSPIPDLHDLKNRNIWDSRSSLNGISWDVEKQIAFMKHLGNRFGEECIWPTDSTSIRMEFFVNNSSFSYGCAASLYAIIRNSNPSRIIEIGSGNSSLVINQALSVNRDEVFGNARSKYTIIDPYPSDVIRELPELTELLQQRVELINPEIFEYLGENDILFIDSSHSVKTGSDVNFLILEVLPRLAPGVIIHFHDIHLPFEYPMAYAINPKFRMFWTEAYLLQAFLCQNKGYEILLAMNNIMINNIEEFKYAFPHYNSKEHKYISSSWWMRRIKDTDNV